MDERQKHNNLTKFGFSFNKNSAHMARTIMLQELTQLLSWSDSSGSSQEDYHSAIIEENCLQKRSVSNRKFTYRHLVELYTLDSAVAIFRTLLFLWNRDNVSQPLLAILCAYARDSILRDTAKQIVSLSDGAVITREDTEAWLDSLYPGRFSDATLRSVAQNINSSWTQSGHLAGRVTKTRLLINPTPGAIAYALFLSYLNGARGRQMFQTEYIKLLDCTEHDAIRLAQEASQRGWINFKRIAEVMEVQFPSFLNEKEMELLVEQNR